MKRHFQLKTIISLLALLFAINSAAFGQEVTGVLNGTVKDANGAGVKGATVTVTDSAKKIVVRTAATDDDGAFTVSELHVGVYDVTVESPNFKKHLESNVKVDVGQRRSVMVTLEVGNVEEVVTVEANPVAVELSTPTVSTLINGEQARELSLNNRNWVQLITLSPGVTNDLADQVYVGTTNPAGQANTVNISINGARSAQNTYTVDGADVTDRGSNITIQAYPSVDSISEFKVLRSLFAAESGRSGGGQINVVTRGGGEEFHGTFYEFVRNDKLNANDFISNRSTNPTFGRESNGKAKRAPFRYNDYGFTLGGPVYFPNFGEGSPDNWVKKAARTYFFFSEEQRKDRRYPLLTAPAGVPDFQMRQGIFPIDICLSAFTAVANGTPACTSVLPRNTPLSSVATINPVAQQYLTFIYNKLPAPSDPVTRNLTAPAQGVFDFRQEIIRLDHSVNDKLSMYYRFEYDKIPTIDVSSIFSSGSNLPGVSTTETQSPGKAHSFQATYVVSPSVVIVGRWNYGYGQIKSTDIGTIALANSPITPPLAFAKTRDFVPTVAGNGFSTLTTFGDYDNFSYKHNFSGDISLLRGRHSMKFGGTYSIYRKNENALAGNNAGAFSGFLNTTPNSAVQSSILAPNAATQETNATRRANFQNFANFLLGNNVTFSQAAFDYVADLRQRTIEAYAQDEFKLKSNLTMYYGVRYSYFGAPYDKNGRLSNFDPSLFNPARAPQVTGAGNRVPGTGDYCNGLIVNSQNVQTLGLCVPTASPYGKYVVKAPKGDFGPRFGLAWDPFKKGETSIRMGYGIYYDQVLNGTYEQNIGTNPPYQQTFTVSAVSNGSAALTPRLDRPVPTGVPVAVGVSNTPFSIRAIQPNWKDPYMQHWSLEWQQQYGSDTIFSVGYFGSKGTHLIGAFELDELAPGVALNSRCATGANTLQTPNVTTVPCQAPGTYFGGTGGQSSNLLDQIRPFRGYRSINMITPQFNSNYHSLQTLAQRRFKDSSQLNIAYTWSKNITDNQTDRSTAPENSYNIRLDRGLATLDRRHVFTGNYIYELPFFKSQSDLKGKILGGWEFSGIVTLQSGLPFTATTNFDAAGLGNVPALVAGNRPNITCDANANAPHTFESWIANTPGTVCFQINPTTGTGFPNVVGNAGRGTIEGPPTKRVDFSAFKNVRFGERWNLQLRGEVFNIFNKTNFRTITSFAIQNLGGTFGTVATVRDPRTIQLGAKLSF
ncbi:MAG TPA: carboxypeptidase regulatory-like domain-containing protein [Pyrinomonadaceae bacterium]|nr:carboxypeptidase regulatory-like domain-containing protein [Pyrinomonadaceae bacterium]